MELINPRRHTELLTLSVSVLICISVLQYIIMQVIQNVATKSIHNNTGADEFVA